MAALLLLLVAPAVGAFGGKPWYVQLFFVGFGVPVLLIVAACLASAVRPGSLGRAVRRARGRKGTDHPNGPTLKGPSGRH